MVLSCSDKKRHFGLLSQRNLFVPHECREIAVWKESLHPLSGGLYVVGNSGSNGAS